MIPRDKSLVFYADGGRTENHTRTRAGYLIIVPCTREAQLLDLSLFSTFFFMTPGVNLHAKLFSPITR